MARKPTTAPTARGRGGFASGVAESFDPQQQKPDWSRRWGLIRAVLLFCAGLGLYIIVFGPGDRLRESAFLGLLTLSGSVVLGYLGFATLDDRHWLQSIARPGADREGKR